MFLAAAVSVGLVIGSTRAGAPRTNPPGVPVDVMAQAPAVCRVTCGSSVGSGCYIGDGLALTCRHLFDGERARAGRATFPNGDRYAWRLVAILADWDSALVEFSAKPRNLRGVRLAAANPRAGEPLYLAGWSTGRAGFRPGRFSAAVGRPGGTMADWGQMAAGANGAAASGDSGGPVFNQAGRLVGNLWGSDGRQTTFLMAGRLHRFLAPHNARLARWHAALARGWCPPSWTGRGSAVTVPADGSEATPTPSATPTPTPSATPTPAPRAVTLSEGDLEAIARKIWVRMQRNPTPFRGLVGPAGPAGPAARVADLPPVVVEIHDRGKIYRQSRPLGEPIKIEITGAQ